MAHRSGPCGGLTLAPVVQLPDLMPVIAPRPPRFVARVVAIVLASYACVPSAKPREAAAADRPGSGDALRVGRATVVDRVFFARQQAALAPAVAALDAFARLALDDARLTLVLVARAETGERAPRRLSERRGAAVKGYLIRRGVPERRIRVLALGRSAGADRCVELAAE